MAVASENPAIQTSKTMNKRRIRLLSAVQKVVGVMHDHAKFGPWRGVRIRGDSSMFAECARVFFSCYDSAGKTRCSRSGTCKPVKVFVTMTA
jgi:hypothetical protein